MNCYGMTRSLEPCKRGATTVVEHRDGEHLTYCKQHAAAWSHRPQRLISRSSIPTAAIQPRRERASTE